MARETPWVREEQILAGEGIDVAAVDGNITITGGFSSKARAYCGPDAQAIPTSSYTKVCLSGESYDGLSEMNVRYVKGTADATEASKLHDADGGFEAGDVGATVWNRTDNTYTTVSAFVDSGELTLTDDIMVDGEDYTLYHARFTATATGYYLITGTVRYYNPDTADTEYVASIYVNGTEASRGRQTLSTDALSIEVGVTDILYLAANDYVELFTFHSQPAVDFISTGETLTYLAIHRLS